MPLVAAVRTTAVSVVSRAGPRVRGFLHERPRSSQFVPSRLRALEFMLRARTLFFALFCAGICRGELYSRAFSWRTASADPLGGQKQLGADQGRVLAVHKAKKNIVLRARRALASSPFVGRVS